MEYIEGVSLKDKITERPLKLEEALDEEDKRHIMAKINEIVQR